MMSSLLIKPCVVSASLFAHACHGIPRQSGRCAVARVVSPRRCGVDCQSAASLARHRSHVSKDCHCKCAWNRTVNLSRILWLCAGKDAVGPLFDGLSGDELEVLNDFNEEWGTHAKDKFKAFPRSELKIIYDEWKKYHRRKRLSGSFAWLPFQG